MIRYFIAFAAFTLFFQTALHAQHGGIKGQKAPSITADQWVSIPKNSEPPTDTSLKGKVIYLYCFQSWCPGCHSSGFPTLQKVSKHFENDDEVQFMAVQTVFEGFGTNTPERAKEMVKKYNLQNIPVGHSGSQNKRSQIMAKFNTRGTPWTIIIGKDGIVHYNAFHIKADAAIKLIESLKK